MIQIKNRTFKKKTVLLMAAAALLVVLILTYVILQAVFSSSAPDPTPDTPLDLIDGESSNLGSRLAYPLVSADKVTSVSIANSTGSYDIVRDTDTGNFVLFYLDENGVKQSYVPPVSVADSTFSYENVYAIATGDGYNRIPKITYLCTALGTLYFNERITLPTDEHERAVTLARYGLDEGSVKTATLRYTKEDKTDGVHTVSIGDKTVTGTGYYFRVDDRDYVYTSRSIQISQSATVNYLDYALASFASYIRPALVSAGLEMDSAYEPYLTTGFRHYKNTLHETEGEAVLPGSEVIAIGRVLSPADVIGKEPDPSLPADAYQVGAYSELSFALSDLSSRSDPSYARLVRALLGSRIGSYYDRSDSTADPADGILLTLSTYSRALDFSASDTLAYRYRITAVESVISDDGENAHAGTAVGTYNLIRVTYDVWIGDEQQNTAPCHGVLDLTSSLLPTDAATALRAAVVGTLADPVSFDVSYTEENAIGRQVQILVTAIVAIADSEGKTQTTVQDGSLVSVHYCYVVDGVRGDTAYMTLQVGGENPSDLAEAAKVLIGRKAANNLEVRLQEYHEACELMADFITYEISDISYFVVPEEIVSFRYQQSSSRDPYYGESLYENLTSGRNKLYGLNSASCENIVRALGGIATDSDSSVTSASGLVGSETVAVGITPAVLKKYGLYAYTIYFELPRGITPIYGDDDDPDDLTEYQWSETLGFTLYISERRVDADGSYYRYVGSDMYDIVVKLADDKINFVDYDFKTLYARRNLVLVDVDDVDEIKVDFNMDDLRGAFDFTMSHRTIYIDANGKVHDSTDDITGSYGDWNLITVRVAPTGANMNTRIEEYIVSHDGYSWVSLTQFYADLHTGGKVQLEGNDPTGTSNYKELVRMLNYTEYSGTLTDEEKASVADDATPLFRMSLLVKASSGYYYTYDFYRVSDRRVMVRLYQAQDGVAMTASVSDFYVSTFTFKKIVSSYLGLLNGKILSSETPYPEG